MQMSLKEWTQYRDLMSQICQKAADEFRDFAFKDNDGLKNLDRQDIINYAYALITKYGQAEGELACLMYEATAEAQGAMAPPAEMAELPDYEEVKKMVNGTMNKSPSGKLTTGGVGRMVKQVGADTTTKNAIRDGAEWAWVPHGDTCAFCITLASRGWQRASKTLLKNEHAEHIHAHCDCQFAVRFDGNSTVEGYDPNMYLHSYRKHGENNHVIINAETGDAIETEGKNTSEYKRYFGN